jgi:zinc-ribbon domain
MYCPKCATQNAEDTKFCRACGTNLSLVPQALTGRLPAAPSDRRRGRHRNREREREEAPSVANGITKAFTGVGFLIVSFAVFFFAPAGRIWWFWMLIPAFATLGKGIAEIVSARYGPNLTQGMNQTAIPAAAARTGELTPRNEALFPPPSVTEQTTRHLDPSTDQYRYRDTDAH